MNRFQEKQVKKLYESRNRLNPWEKDFITSLKENLDHDDDYELSEKQNSVLNRLVSEYV